MSHGRLNRRTLLAAGAAALAAPALAQGTRPEPNTIAYGPHPLQRIDVYRAPEGAAAPCLAWVPGGSWVTTDRRWVNALPELARRQRFALASIGHRLGPQASAAEQAGDVAAAVAKLAAEGSALGVDPRRIFLGGHSSGAHLAALTAVDPRYLAAHGLRPASLAGVVLLDGAGYDARDRGELTTGQPGSAEVFERIFGPDPGLFSPTLLAGAAEGPLPPFLLFYVQNRPYAVTQTLGFAQALRAAGARVDLQPVSGHSHVSVAVAFGDRRDRQGRRAASFMRAHGGDRG